MTLSHSLTAISPAHAWLTHVAWLSAAVTAFLVLAVARGWTARLDERILRISHHAAPGSGRKPGRLTTAIQDLTALGGDTLRLLFLAGCLAGLLAAGRAASAGALVGIFVSARLVLYLLKAAVRRPRPAIDEHGVVTFTSSFPSGHTFMAVVLFLSAALILTDGAPAAVTRVAIAFALATSLSIGATRMSLGVHWPSDILVGWLAGLAWTCGCMLLP